MSLGGSKPSGSTTTTSKSEPWAGQIPYLNAAFREAERIYSDPNSQAKYYPGQTIAGQSGDTKLAQTLLQRRALQGSPITDAAKGYLTDTLGGGFLNSNPYLDKTFNQAADQVQSRVNSAFGSAGRFGSGLNQRVLGDSLGDLATDIYGGNYQQERNRMQQGLLFAPQMANQDYTDIGQLANLGAQKDARAQDFINADIDRYNFDRNAAWNNLSNYANMVQGNYGQSATATEPYFRNKTGEALGTLGQLGGMAGDAAMMYMLLSDIRLKEDIELIGTENNFPVYRFRYRGRPERFVGVMAQDIQKLRPEAVGTIGGYLAVDYGRIGVNFRRAA